MNRLWKRRVPKDIFIIGWILLLSGVIQGIVGITFIVLAFT